MKTTNVSEETYDLIKDQLPSQEKIDISCLEDFIGKKIFFRTVTYHILGKVEKIIGKVFILSNASWVADSGKFSTAIKKGELDEVEYLGDWNINFESVTDFGFWKNDLPNKTK